MLLCAICGRFPLLLEIYSPTDSTDIHRFYISQYPCSSVLSVGNTFAPNIRVHLCYLWEILSHPISVLICDICGSPLCCLRLFSHRLHRFYISQYPCSSLLSVGNTFAPNICVYLCYLWEIPSHDDGSSYSFIDSEMRPLR